MSESDGLVGRRRHAGRARRRQGLRFPSPSVMVLRQTLLEIRARARRKEASFFSGLFEYRCKLLSWLWRCRCRCKPWESCRNWGGGRRGGPTVEASGGAALEVSEGAWADQSGRDTATRRPLRQGGPGGGKSDKRNARAAMRSATSRRTFPKSSTRICDAPGPRFAFCGRGRLPVAAAPQFAGAPGGTVSSPW